MTEIVFLRWLGSYCVALVILYHLALLDCLTEWLWLQTIATLQKSHTYLKMSYVIKPHPLQNYYRFILVTAFTSSALIFFCLLSVMKDLMFSTLLIWYWVSLWGCWKVLWLRNPLKKKRKPNGLSDLGKWVVPKISALTHINLVLWKKWK